MIFLRVYIWYWLYMFFFRLRRILDFLHYNTIRIERIAEEKWAVAEDDRFKD